MNPPLFEQEASGIGIEHRMRHQSAEVFHIGRKFFLRLLGRLPFGEDDVMLIGQPFTSLDERFSKDVHRKVNRASVGIAHETFVCVVPYVKRERRVAVSMKRTEGFMLLHLQA
jgi:hypothetical protein